MNTIGDQIKSQHLLKIKKIVDNDDNGDKFIIVRTKKNIDFIVLEMLAFSTNRTGELCEPKEHIGELYEPKERMGELYEPKERMGELYEPWL